MLKLVEVELVDGLVVDEVGVTDEVVEELEVVVELEVIVGEVFDDDDGVG